MLKTDLQEIIEAGEGAKTEFKRDGVRPEQLAAGNRVFRQHETEGGFS